MKLSLLSRAATHIGVGCLAAALLAAFAGQAAEPQVRLSIKFILNSSGNRPATGSLNTDTEITDQIARGNAIFANYLSEFRIQSTEILEVSGQSAYYLNDATAASRDEIRNAALANPGAFFWRNNAVNVYITGANASGYADFPPDNNIFVLGQGVNDTTLVHETGHILNLIHTHQGGGADNCSDTLPDDEDWTRDQISQNSYGLNYNQLNASQKTLVDNTWGNLMSYHDTDNRSVLTPCQLDRISAQGYTDRNWLLNQVPTYVRAGAPVVPLVDMGSWAFPYPTVQDAINGGEVNNRALVLLTGTHDNPASVITTDTDIIPRRGPCTIQDGKPEYQLPYNLEDSTNAAVRAAVIRAQQFDRRGDTTNAVAALQEAAGAASGRERDALNLELGQRFGAMKRFSEAEVFFTKVFTQADQAALRTKAQRKAETMKAKHAERNKGAQKASSDDSKKEEKK